jgi:hypothetical protein
LNFEITIAASCNWILPLKFLKEDKQFIVLSKLLFARDSEPQKDLVSCPQTRYKNITANVRDAI